MVVRKHGWDEEKLGLSSGLLGFYGVRPSHMGPLPEEGNQAPVATRWQCSAAQVPAAAGSRGGEKVGLTAAGRLSKTQISITQRDHPTYSLELLLTAMTVPS